MPTHDTAPGSARSPLDVAAAAFRLLVTGPDPLSIDGRSFAGLPDRTLALHQLRELLLARGCPPATRDAVWAQLVSRSREHGGAWTVGCVGVALPALGKVVTELCGPFLGDASDIHAAVLTGFLVELGRVELDRPKVMLRLRWAAFRAGRACLREALDAPVPRPGHPATAGPPPPPWGHPDFVLARAVADGVISGADAELIGHTRLEGVPLLAAAAATGQNYDALRRSRSRAEAKLAAYLATGHHETDHRGAGQRPQPDGLTDQVATRLAITTAGHRQPEQQRAAEAEAGERPGKKVRTALSHNARKTGVIRWPHTQATTTPEHPTEDKQCA